MNKSKEKLPGLKTKDQAAQYLHDEDALASQLEEIKGLISYYKATGQKKAIWQARQEGHLLSNTKKWLTESGYKLKSNRGIYTITWQ